MPEMETKQEGEQLPPEEKIQTSAEGTLPAEQPEEVDRSSEKGAPVIDPEVFADDPRLLAIQQDAARQALADARGEEEPVYGILGWFWNFYHKYIPKHQKRRLKKKTYLLLMLFLGWMGGHRWYQRRFIMASFYTFLCFTGIPLVLCVTDLMEVLPVKADEDGYIEF